MNSQYSAAEVLEMLRTKQGTRTMTELADEIGIVLPYLSRIFAGKDEPGPRVLNYLGLKKVHETRYEVA